MRMRSAVALTFIASEHVRQCQRGGVLPTMVMNFNRIFCYTFRQYAPQVGLIMFKNVQYS